MKLLDRNTLNNQKSLERKREIDEGVKLARKLDTLREEVSKEEVKLKKYLAETSHEVQTQINALVEEKSSLEEEIQTLSEERKILVEPLDNAWKEVKEREVKISEKEEELIQKYEDIKNKEKELRKRKAELDLEEERQQDSQKGIAKLFKEASQETLKARSLVQDATRREKEVDRKATETTRILTNREKEIEAREIDLGNLRIFLEKKDKELQNEDRRLKDLYQTLLRNQKRLN